MCFAIVKEERISSGFSQYLAVIKLGAIQLISIDKVIKMKNKTIERIHKSYLVKTSEIKEIIVKTGSRYAVELKNGEMPPVGRTRYKALKEKLFQ